MFWNGRTAMDGLSGSGSSGSPEVRRHAWCKAIAAPGDRFDAAAVRSPLVKDPTECPDLHVQIVVANHRRRPDGSEHLIPQYEASCSSDQHPENVKRPQAYRYRYEHAILIPPEQTMPVETKSLEQESAALRKRVHAFHAPPEFSKFSAIYNFFSPSL
jgi:hypothetical protein